MGKVNGVLMQYFHWYLPNDGGLWKQVIKDAKKLSEMGITALWLPPAYKGTSGINSVGYDVYDMYDLGEFDQKGTIRTKYGTKDEYLKAIEAAHKYGIQILGDVVFNHRGGADYKERMIAVKVDRNNRNVDIGEPRIIEAWTKFTFPGRIKYDENQDVKEYKYSNFTWDYLYFDGVDWDEKAKESAIFRIIKYGDTWDIMPDEEKGNYDYLMFADIDTGSKEVRQELKNWVEWYLDFTKVDGFRLDAIKHISIQFFNEWLDYIREKTGKEIFTVGEYWQPNRGDLVEKYLYKVGFRISLFDAPLQNNFYKASKEKQNFDLRRIFDNTLVSKYPVNSVTLVGNHDTQPLQALEAPVEEWFKPIAYTFILLRAEGYPCVFYPDIYGAKYTDKGHDGKEYSIELNRVKELPALLTLRRKYNYGEQVDYFDYPTTVGWVRLGDENSKSPMAVVVSVGKENGFKDMYVGTEYAQMEFTDFLGKVKQKVRINEKGLGRFLVNSASVSVWVLS